MSRLIALVLLAVAVLPALETPLIIGNTSGNASVVVNPQLGTMTYYALEDGRLNRKSSANFLVDLQLYGGTVQQFNGQEPFTALRLGVNTKKDYAAMFTDIFEALGTTRAEKEAGVQSLAQRARQTELEFWAKEHPYDGVVRAALSERYLMLAVPAMRALLLYEVASENFNLAAVRYYGTELYIPHVYGSSPTPAQILSQLPADVREERKKQFEDQIKALTESKTQTIDVKPSDLWIAAGQNERFVVFDIANLHLMSYEFTGKFLELRAVRNLEIDLLIPTSFNARPDIAEIFARWKRDAGRQQWLKAMGMENDLDTFTSYVESRQGENKGGATKVSPVQASVILKTGDVLIDFGEKRKAAVYRFGGNQTMDLYSLRDYTIDIGISLLDGDIRRKVAAASLFATARGQQNLDIAFLNLRSALQLDPLLVREVEKDKRLLERMKKHPEWEKLIENAANEAKAIEDKIKAIQEAAQKRREERAKKP